MPHCDACPLKACRVDPALFRGSIASNSSLTGPWAAPCRRRFYGRIKNHQTPAESTPRVKCPNRKPESGVSRTRVRRATGARRRGVARRRLCVVAWWWRRRPSAGRDFHAVMFRSSGTGPPRRAGSANPWPVRNTVWGSPRRSRGAPFFCAPGDGAEMWQERPRSCRRRQDDHCPGCTPG